MVNIKTIYLRVFYVVKDNIKLTRIFAKENGVCKMKYIYLIGFL